MLSTGWAKQGDCDAVLLIKPFHYTFLKISIHFQNYVADQQQAYTSPISFSI